ALPRSGAPSQGRTVSSGCLGRLGHALAEGVLLGAVGRLEGRLLLSPQLLAGLGGLSRAPWISCSVASRALAETHLPYAFLPFLFVPYFFVNAAVSAARSALHALAAFLRSVAARPSRLATHASVALEALPAAYVAVKVFVPIFAFSLSHTAFARSPGEGARSAASAPAGTAR